ncbi:transmembrane protein, putative [Medicago truncatula]|uniref:Transmembrane protein, putative n=1 Tax=Medicago truncatula TaxID=3880 RepID=G7JZA7_MEDTR|nr:transmembrane protein, putative [Medicago truncatula]
MPVILHDALWPYRTAYKTPLGMSPYILVYGNVYHFSIELKYKAKWAMKKLNLNLGKSSRHRMLLLLEHTISSVPF